MLALTTHISVWGFKIARTGIGTIIGRKSVSKGREYRRIWIYIPTKVSDDTAFPFKVGEPCLVEIDITRKSLTVKPVNREQAIKLGWRAERKRTILRQTKNSS